MARGRPPAPRFPCRIPRRCGDGPILGDFTARHPEDSPQVRGWPGVGFPGVGVKPGFPAGAGMARDCYSVSGSGRRIPRRCGDGPPRSLSDTAGNWDSPQVRGWPFRPCVARDTAAGFPAGAGMAQSEYGISATGPGIPRRCQRQLSFERFRQLRIDPPGVGGKLRQLRIDPPPFSCSAKMSFV